MTNSDISMTEIILLIILLVIARIMFVMHKITMGYTKVTDKKRNKPVKTLICIGSGGHTTEMLLLMEGLDFAKYTPRCYVMAKTDKTSYNKVKRFENNIGNNNYEVYNIPRSREVRQPYFSSVFSTLYSIFYSIPLVFKYRPDLILCNGPGTCIPICGLAFLLKAAFICDTKIVFVESYCRTETFSLTGRILMYFADNIIVQWPKLQQKLKRSEYVGQLM